MDSRFSLSQLIPPTGISRQLSTPRRQQEPQDHRRCLVRKSPLARAPDLVEIALFIPHTADIDLDLFGNLPTLWNDTPDQPI